MAAESLNFQVGQKASLSKIISIKDIEAFADVTGDFNPVHVDEDSASRTRFKGRIAHGLLSAGLVSAVLGTELPGPGGIYLSQDLQFIKPVYPGDRITAEVEIVSWDPEKKIIRLHTRCQNQHQEEVLKGQAVLLVEEI
jgi:3-hydroxybutyryl-CoA dehydratase